MSEPTKAKLFPVEGPAGKGDPATAIDVQFNPTTLKVSLSNSLKANEKSENTSAAQYVDKSASSLTVELLFDTSIEDEDVRAHALRLVSDPLEAGVRQHEELAGRVEAPAEQTLCPQTRLVGGLLAGDIEDAFAVPGERRRRLEKERRLPDAGISAEQRDRARNEAPAKHAVELADTAGQSLDRGGLDRRKRHRPGR